MQRTVFASVDEAMEELAPPELLELLRLSALDIPGIKPNPEIQAQSQRLLWMIESGALRKKLQELFDKEGKVEFGYSQEAWNLLRGVSS